MDVLLLRVILRISEELYRTLFGSGMIFSFPSALNLTEGTYRKETRCQWFSVYSLRTMRLARLFSVRIKGVSGCSSLIFWALSLQVQHASAN